MHVIRELQGEPAVSAEEQIELARRLGVRLGRPAAEAGTYGGPPAPARRGPSRPLRVLGDVSEHEFGVSLPLDSEGFWRMRSACGEVAGPLLDGLKRSASEVGRSSGGLIEAHVEGDVPAEPEPLQEEDDMRRVEFDRGSASRLSTSIVSWSSWEARRVGTRWPGRARWAVGAVCQKIIGRPLARPGLGLVKTICERLLRPRSSTRSIAARRRWQWRTPTASTTSASGGHSSSGWQ